METNVGRLREQTAYCSSDRPIIIITDDKDLPPLEVVDFFPDTTNGSGEFISTFKIKVQRK